MLSDLFWMTFGAREGVVVAVAVGEWRGGVVAVVGVFRDMGITTSL
jgi:hypothetical protein